MKRLFVLIAALALMFSVAASQPKQAVDTDGLVSLDFVDADIRDVIKAISEMTHKNFLIDKSVQGKITIISPTKVTPEEAYEIFLSILDVNGYTVVKSGKIYKILPKEDARKEALSL
ncbi:MAG TPA: type II secretion system protein GspD, partial [Proteobacteria bacterium]|nr:type II secretion system protein GspD [Pseudomonadota bacterium]